MDVGAAIRQQMLSMLIDTIGKQAAIPAGAPAISALAQAGSTGARPGENMPGALAQLPPLQPGAQVFARVIEAPANGDAVIAIGDRMVTARIAGQAMPEAARQPGATLLLRLETTGETPRFTLLQAEPAANGPRQPTASPVGLEAAARAGQAATAGIAGEPARVRPQVLIEAAEPLSTPAPRGKIEAPSLPALLQASAATAATRQSSAALLFAELAPLLGRPDAPLQPAATAVAQMIFQSRLDAEQPISPQALKDAVQRSAVPAEALVARGETAVPDMKTLVAALRGLLATAERRPPPETGPDAEPPHRDGSPSAIRPALPRLEPDAEPRMVAGALVREADQTVERSRLHQLASLPDPKPLEATRQHLSFELPLALGQQTAIAGFRIERDKGRARNADNRPVDSWGVRFAIDADGLGPVQAHLRLTGQAVSVSLWAEDVGTRQRFLDALPTLEAALAENALDIGELMILGGRPAEAKPPSGLFLDRSS